MRFAPLFVINYVINNDRLCHGAAPLAASSSHASTARTIALLFSIASSHSELESLSVVIAPPAPMNTSPEPGFEPGFKTAVRITTFRSNASLTEKNPIEPLYAPRALGSSASMISIVRGLGAPVMDPGGNAARAHATGDAAASSLVPTTVLTS